MSAGSFDERDPAGRMPAWAVAGPLEHRVFLLSGNEQHAVGEVLEAFRRHLPGLEYRVVARNEANHPVDIGRRPPRHLNQRAATALGWTPRTSFADGMREYLAWIAANGPQ